MSSLPSLYLPGAGSSPLSPCFRPPQGACLEPCFPCSGVLLGLAHARLSPWLSVAVKGMPGVRGALVQPRLSHNVAHTTSCERPQGSEHVPTRAQSCLYTQALLDINRSIARLLHTAMVSCAAVSLPWCSNPIKHLTFTAQQLHMTAYA